MITCHVLMTTENNNLHETATSHNILLTHATQLLGFCHYCRLADSYLLLCSHVDQGCIGIASTAMAVLLSQHKFLAECVILANLY